MDERDFVSKLIGDKAFLEQMSMKIPEDVLRELAAKSAAQAEAQKRGEQGSAADMGELMSEYFAPVAQAMGNSFDQGVFASEIDRQFGALGTFAKIKFGVRYAKAIMKANKQYGIK